jgi:IMP cyclohydrolase
MCKSDRETERAGGRERERLLVIAAEVLKIMKSPYVKYGWMPLIQGHTAVTGGVVTL